MPSTERDLFSSESIYRWSGLYMGFNAGYLSGRAKFDMAGYPAGAFSGLIPPIPAHTQAENAAFIGGAQYGYNYQIGSLVLGFENDFMMTPNPGTGAPQAQVLSSGVIPGVGAYDLLQTQRLEWLSTLRGKVGWSSDDRTLIYGTGGLAFGDVKTTTQLGTAFVGDRRDYRVGWALGGGVEYAMTEDLSISAEYLHVDLPGPASVATPSTATSAELHTSAGYTADIFRSGINYKFDNQQIDARTRQPVTTRLFPNAEIEFGSRYWYSTGTTSKNLYGTTGSDPVSRLTYSDLTAHSGEIFTRLDHRSGFFIKGFVGTGLINGGNLQDEDFPPVTAPYSSTTSEQRNGTLLYGSGDVGYNLFRNSQFQIGPFVGYHFERETVNARGCAQTASNTVCAPAVDNNILVITENAKWKSLRVGVNGEMAWGRMKVSLEGAWLPSITLESTDTHWLRIQPIAGNFAGPIPEDGSGTQGLQLEGMVSYLLTDTFSVGVGARYWRMETTSGSAHFEGNIVGGGGSPQPVTFVTERYGGFVQGSYRF